MTRKNAKDVSKNASGKNKEKINDSKDEFDEFSGNNNFDDKFDDFSTGFDDFSDDFDSEFADDEFEEESDISLDEIESNFDDGIFNEEYENFEPNDVLKFDDFKDDKQGNTPEKPMG